MASCNARLQQRLDARALRRNSQVSVLGSLGENVQFFAQAGRHILRGQRCCDARVVCANGSILGTHDVSKIRVFPRASVVHNGSADVVHFTGHSRRIRGLRRSILHPFALCSHPSSCLDRSRAPSISDHRFRCNLRALQLALALISFLEGRQRLRLMVHACGKRSADVGQLRVVRPRSTQHADLPALLPPCP